MKVIQISSTPDKSHQAVSRKARNLGWAPSVTRPMLEPNSLLECLEHVAFHLEVGGDISACGCNPCVPQIIGND